MSAKPDAPQAAPKRRPSTVSRTITLAGKSYVLLYDWGAIGALEDAYDMPIKRVAERLNDPEELRIKDIEKILWAGMLHANPTLTLEEAKGILAEAVTSGQTAEEIMNSAFAAFDASAGEDEVEKTDPPTAAPAT